MTPRCPKCGAEGFRKDTAGPYYECNEEDCRVTEFRRVRGRR